MTRTTPNKIQTIICWGSQDLEELILHVIETIPRPSYGQIILFGTRFGTKSIRAECDSVVFKPYIITLPCHKLVEIQLCMEPSISSPTLIWTTVIQLGPFIHSFRASVVSGHDRP